jgi:hypothetical protein
MPYDIALAEDEEGRPMMHAANCPQVRKLAADGHPVATLYQCQTLPTDIKRHECMKGLK